MNTIYPTLQTYLPANFNAEKLKGYNYRWHEKYEWFIHSITYKQLTTRNDFNNYVNLSSTILQHFLGQRYFSKVRATLINNKVIEYNKTYSAGGFSQSYRLTEKYNNAPIIQKEITKQTYCRKIFSYNQNYLDNLLKDDLHRREFTKLTEWNIRVNDALDYVASRVDYNSKQKEGRKLQIFEVQKMHQTKKEGGIIQANFTFKKDRAGRLHTPLTNLASDLRQFLFNIYKPDAKLICNDFSNSQIVCFASKHLTEKSHNIGRGSIKTNPYQSKHTGRASTPSQALSGQSHPAPYVMTITKDLKLFKSLVFSGDFYDQLMKATNFKGIRSEFKEKFFAELWYNSNKRGKKVREKLTSMEQTFKRYFPNVFNILWTIKANIGNREFCIGLQREEARLMHRILIESLSRKASYFIVHDAIYTTEDNQKEVIELLESLAPQYFGNRVSIKWELCN